MPRNVRSVTGDNEIVPRLSDLHSLYASTAGKLELEYAGEDKKDDDLIERLINRSVLKVFDRFVKLEDLKPVTTYFEEGWGVEVSDRAPASEYMDALREVPGLREVVEQTRRLRVAGPDGDRERVVFEGLHLHQKLNKDRSGRPLRLPRLTRTQRLREEIRCVNMRYTQWDGTQQLKLDAGKVFEKLAEYLSYTDDIRQAMDWMMRQGMDFDGVKVTGLEEFLEQLRQEMRQRYRDFNLKNALSGTGAEARRDSRSGTPDAGFDARAERRNRGQGAATAAHAAANCRKRCASSKAMNSRTRRPRPISTLCSTEYENIRDLENFRDRYNHMFHGPEEPRLQNRRST